MHLYRPPEEGIGFDAEESSSREARGSRHGGSPSQCKSNFNMQKTNEEQQMRHINPLQLQNSDREESVREV